MFVMASPLQLFGEEERESQSQTVSQALLDLRSGIADKRRGSVMLLAKYPQHPSALPAIVSALDDPEATVRRAAAVSLGENIRRLTPSQASRLASALTDEDPEVRLTSSAWLPQLVLQASAFPATRPGSPAPADPQIRDGLTRGMIAGLQDPEPLVRLKALEALQYFRWPIQQDLLLPLMNDPDKAVRLQAYQTLYTKLPPSLYIARASSLYPDENEGVRLVLAEVLSRQPAPGSAALLRKLSEDPAANVRLQASVGLFMADPSAGLPESLETALLERDLESAIVFRIFNSINRLPPNDRLGFIEPLLDAKSVLVRTQAVLRWMQWNQANLSEKFVEAVFNDPAGEVRQVAIRQFSRPQAQLPPAFLFTLPDNPYEDVRLQTFALSTGLSIEDQAALALRLLMDTVPAVRAQAVARIIELRPPGWSRILKASLRDPAPEVQRVAAQALLDKLGPEGHQIAEDFARNHPDADITSLIRLRLGLN